jgi:uncharacterized protein YkwD
VSIAARLGLYAVLAAIVLASFAFAPGRSTTSLAVRGAAREAATLEPVALIARGLRETPGLVAAPVASTYAPPDFLQLGGPLADVEPSATPSPTPEPTPSPAARAGRATGAIVTPTTLAAEAHMLDLMNASRTKAGLVPLVMDATAADAARSHSLVESQVRYVYHDGPDGSASSRNVPACGTGWYGENTGKIWNDNVDALHIEFMAEPWQPINHRTNIMDPLFRRVGVGAVLGPDAMYMTMVFCR